MRFIFAALMLATIVFTGPANAADSGLTDTILRGFYAALGDYYGVPEREVIVVRERRILDEEIPVILYLSKKAHVRPSIVSDLRLRGLSWTDITRHFGLSPEIFYVPVNRFDGPPYGKAYGHFKKKPRSEWSKIYLQDDDVVNLVNLRFISDHYGYSPDEVAGMRSRGQNFMAINDKVRHAKKESKHEHRKPGGESKGSGNKHANDKHPGKEKKEGKHHGN